MSKGVQVSDKCKQPGSGNDNTGDGEVTNEDFENVFDWSAWNENAENSLNYWNNKYDRGECSVDPCSPDTTGNPDTTGTSGTSGDPSPEYYQCPRVERVAVYPCSKVKIFMLGGKDAL